MKPLTETVAEPRVGACYFEEVFQPRLAAMRLEWPDPFIAQEHHSWELPDGVTLGGPAPAGGGKFGSFAQSFVCICPVNLLSGYITICEMTGCTACVSSGVDSLKTRGITTPTFVLARKTPAIPLGADPFQSGPVRR